GGCWISICRTASAFEFGLLDTRKMIKPTTANAIMQKTPIAQPPTIQTTGGILVRGDRRGRRVGGSGGSGAGRSSTGACEVAWSRRLASDVDIRTSWALAGTCGLPMMKTCWQVAQRTCLPTRLSGISKIFKQLGQVT